MMMRCTKDSRDWKVKNRTIQSRFNVVSCGYALKAIKDGTAHSYFPDCAAMPGIIPAGQ